MRTLWCTLVRPHQDYASQLWAPVASLPAIRDQESPLRAFTKRVAGFRDLHYWERLALSGLSSTERRVDRYRCLYVWKIIRGIAPNCGLSWAVSGRRGLLVTLPPISGSRMAIRTLRESSFFTAAPRVFNQLPEDLRAFTGSLACFKAQLGRLLLVTPDLPVSDSRPTFARDREGRETNSLEHWLQTTRSSSLAKQIHIDRYGSGTRADLVGRMALHSPGGSCPSVQGHHHQGHGPGHPGDPWGVHCGGQEGKEGEEGLPHPHQTFPGPPQAV